MAENLYAQVLIDPEIATSWESADPALTRSSIKSLVEILDRYAVDVQPASLADLKTDLPPLADQILKDGLHRIRCQLSRVKGQEFKWTSDEEVSSIGSSFSGLVVLEREKGKILSPSNDVASWRDGSSEFVRSDCLLEAETFSSCKDRRTSPWKRGEKLDTTWNRNFETLAQSYKEVVLVDSYIGEQIATNRSHGFDWFLSKLAVSGKKYITVYTANHDGLTETVMRESVRRNARLALERLGTLTIIVVPRPRFTSEIHARYVRFHERCVVGLDEGFNMFRSPKLQKHYPHVECSLREAMDIESKLASASGVVRFNLIG